MSCGRISSSRHTYDNEIGHKSKNLNACYPKMCNEDRGLALSYRNLLYRFTDKPRSSRKEGFLLLNIPNIEIAVKYILEKGFDCSNWGFLIER